jgi:hypothetical protein
MAMYVESGAAFEAVLESGWTGLTPSVEIIDNDGNVVTGPTTLNIVEDGVSGIYIWNAPAAPGPEGQYTIVWSLDGTYADDTVTVESMVVVAAGALPDSAIPAPVGGGLAFGPCTAWVTAEDVAACCNVETSTGTIFQDVAYQASQLLFELSGRLFSGSCGPKKVRPDCSGCSCGYQVLPSGYVITPDQWSSLCDLCLVNCSPSLVKLAGYPIRSITEVMIDGVALNPLGNYRLHRHRYAMRLDSKRWPTRQNLTIPDTEDGTFSISYMYGQSPPLAGSAAAGQLACELYKECAGEACALPKGTTRQTRQGITIEKLAFTTWGFQGQWRTGMPLVDAFLSAYNPTGMRRQPVFWAPGKRQYAQEWQG